VVRRERQEARLRQPAGPLQAPAHRPKGLARPQEDLSQVHHGHNRQTEECADGTTLKESADGSSLIFLSNNRSLVFDLLNSRAQAQFQQKSSRHSWEHSFVIDRL